jgi:hypothetical protein
VERDAEPGADQGDPQQLRAAEDHGPDVVSDDAAVDGAAEDPRSEDQRQLP